MRLEPPSSLQCRNVLSLFCLASLWSSGVLAQDLEPRAYTVSPLGANSALLSFAQSRGAVLTDPTLPVEDLKATITTAAVGYSRSLNVFSRTGSVTLSAPYAWGTAQGSFLGAFEQASRSGLGDGRVRFAVNLKGAPSMTPKEFREYRQGTLVGVSLVISLPTGQYDPQRFINLGTNRWAFKPEIGFSRAMARDKRWVLDAYAGVWMFTANPQFVSGIRKQAPMLTTQFHLNYRVRPGLWASFDATFYTGGKSNVNGVPRDDRQQNTRLGGTVSVPIHGPHILKFTASTGAIVRVGGDFNNFAIGYQYVWLDK